MNNNPEEKINISLKNILNIINEYIWNNMNSKEFKKSVYKWEFHFDSEYRKEQFKDLLTLNHEWAIKLHILSYEDSYENEKQNIYIKKELKKYQLYEKWLIWILKGSIPTKKKNIIEISDIRFKNWNIKKVKIKWFKSYSIYRNWNSIEKYIPWFSSFKIEIIIHYERLFHILFKIISQERENNKLTNSKIILELIKSIKEETKWKSNYDKKTINIFYNFNSYLKNKYSIFPILKELERQWNLKIESMVLKNNLIYFNLQNLISIEKETFNNALSQVIKEDTYKIEFKNENLYINNNPIFWNRRNTKIFEIIKLIFNYFIDNKTNKGNYTSLINYVNKNNLYSDFKKLDTKKISYTYLRRDIKIKCDEIEKKLWISNLIETNSTAIKCRYFIH